MRFLYITILAAAVCACSDIGDADFSDRKTFIHLYEGPTPFSAVKAEVTPDGFAILGNTVFSEDSVAAVIILTDKLGNEISPRTYFPHVTAKSMTALRTTGGDISGYIIIGDSIKITPGADPAANTEIYSTQLIKLNTSGNFMAQQTITDTTTNESAVKVDFKANAVTVTPDNQVVMLGTYKTVVTSPEKPFIVSYDDNLSVINWSENYDVIERNYINGKSVHYYNGHIIWASAILKPQGTFNDSYLSIPFVEESSVFVNNDLYKENQSQLLLAGDIQPSSTPEFGYGFVGTYGTTAGDNTNILFMRIDVHGSIVPGSQRYFDGAMLLGSGVMPSVETESVTEEAGLSLTATNDGGFALACALTSTPTLGGGLRDILLIKVDAQGSPVWWKLIGGVGDEVVASIHETEDGGLLLTGTSTIAGFSNIFVMRTDALGEIKD